MISLNYVNKYLVFVIIYLSRVKTWFPDPPAKLIFEKGDENLVQFIINETVKQHFKFLDQTQDSIIIGARNFVYYLSLKNLKENKNKRIDWESSTANQELCFLKGKLIDDCQNYIRIFAKLPDNNYLVCGTNSFKPLCRIYSYKNNQYDVQQESQRNGVCPFDPNYNSTATFDGEQLYVGTMSTFSGDDPLIFREPSRTEQYDLKKLNAPNFVNSFPYDEYVFFFFREAAVEHMNSGKAIYSRIARVCRKDKGGPIKNDTWTSFLKARLNCSVPGEYPFYFDEIQSITNFVDISSTTKLIFGVFTTSMNAIGGSAVCAYEISDILRVFNGDFKYQENIRSNWLTVPEKDIPRMRPGQCVPDSRVLPEQTVDFIKHRFLMDDGVPMFGKQPLLKSVSLYYRYSAIAAESQVYDIYNNSYNILYIGTSDGKVIKAINILRKNELDTFQIWQSQTLPLGVPVRDIKINKSNRKIIIIADNYIQLKDTNYCSTSKNCGDCIALRDPSCAWDEKLLQCVQIINRSLLYLKQNVQNSKKHICSLIPNDVNKHNLQNEIVSENDDQVDISLVTMKTEELTSDNKVSRKIILSATGSLYVAIIIAVLSFMLIGFSIGYFVAKRYQIHAKYLETPFIEQHNQLNRLTNTSVNSNSSNFVTPKTTKTVNLEVNIPNLTLQKKDNLDLINNVNIVKKIKKTYI